MTLGVVPPSTARRGPAGLFGASRVMIAGPAMIGSGLLMLVLFGWMGQVGSAGPVGLAGRFACNDDASRGANCAPRGLRVPAPN